MKNHLSNYFGGVFLSGAITLSPGLQGCRYSTGQPVQRQSCLCFPCKYRSKVSSATFHKPSVTYINVNSIDFEYFYLYYVFEAVV